MVRIKLTLNIDIDTEESKSAIADRLKCVDYGSVLTDDIDYALDEFGEVDGIEMDDIEASEL